ncbi:MAG: malectin domain-containing carbohydrate-binding protein [Verrucomicrobiia bacterium]|jgi:beta-glucanase (GH16 family)
MKLPQHLDVPCAKIKQVVPSLTLGALILYGVLGGGARVAQGQTLSLVWSDEFNGASIDLTKWTFDIGNGSDGWGNGEDEYYTSNSANAFVTNGFLHIHAMLQVTNTAEGTFNYTSARMKTQGLYWKTYGRIEWRASLPEGTGFWPALWMLGTNINSVGWPECGEIDVVENDGTPTFVQGSIHYGSDATAVYDLPNGGSVTNFHIYDLDWTSNSITWSVDGVAYETQTSWVGNTTAFNEPFFFLMNVAIGGSYLGYPTTNSINPSLPGDMVVDYIRVYNYVTPTNPPAMPTGLVATPGGAMIGLNWNASSNAVNYNVKRSTVNGGPYTTIASPTTTSYEDTGVVSCSTYYYVVSGTNSYGESANSTGASATVGSYSFAVTSGNTTPVGTFVADTDYTGGIQAAPTTSSIMTTGLTNPAPQAVYQHERYDNFYYTFGGLTTGTSYTVRLHFAEIYWTGSGEREFNVFINGSQVLTNFDIFAAAGGENIALVRQYTVMPMANGHISVAYSNGAVDDAKSSGIEIILPAPAAPTGLTAIGGLEQVALAWNAVSGAAGYDVQRSTVSGGPYTTVTNRLTGSTYTDTGLADSTTYYYVVTTVESGCQSTNSVEVSATTTTPLSPFQQWQIQYFGSTTNPLAAANVDVDGTGQNNLFKYAAGLNPTNPASVFVLTIATDTNSPAWQDLTFDPWATGRVYTLQFSTDLVNGAWMPLTAYAGPVTNNAGQITIIDTNAVQPQEFYRIQISAP